MDHSDVILADMEALTKALIYLWTRDGNMPVGPETEKYVRGHLQAILEVETIEHSDLARAEMAGKLAEEAIWP